MADNWVDFKTVKAEVSMREVLDYYSLLKFRRNRNELRGWCPICKSKDDDPFSANTEKNNFQCFSCKAHGNVLDFVAAMEKCSVRDAALKLVEWFDVDGDRQTAPDDRAKNTGSQLATKKDQAPESGGEATAENKPLTFQLQGVDPLHPYLAQRGITTETATEFGVGFFSGKGSMSGRVVIPIHNERGELVAYAGRSIDGSEPRYKFPPGFHKAGELYNLHRAIAAPPGSTVVVVEGFFDCIKVHTAGFPCVALMGCTLSQRQQELLQRYFTGVVLMLDGDETGWRCMDDSLLTLAHSGMWVKAVIVPPGKQPDQLQPDELCNLLNS